MKTFVYLAALENGIEPTKIFEDAPVSVSQGPGMPIWRPKNYKGDFLGPITMRVGLEKSRNLITVRVANAIGLSKVAEAIQRFGISDNPKKVYSMVLGSLETTLDKMTSAYATIANYGQKVTPYYVELIKDHNGKIIYRRDNRTCQICEVADGALNNAEVPVFSEIATKRITDPTTSYQIISILNGATQRGTSASSKKLGKILAGKTGTTNDSKDTWFVGFTPRIIVGTYVGYDTPKDMGKTATGASVALPIFIDFMENIYADIPSIPFKIPNTIKLISIDLKTGEPSTTAGSIMEAFRTTPIEAAEPDTEINLENNNEDDAFKNLPTTPEKDHSAEIY
jgi:penicillin-binding protein 1A